MKNRKLATILIIFILSSTVLIFVTVLLYNYRATRETLLRELAEDARNLTLATARQIETILTATEKVPLDLAAVIEELSPRQDQLFRLLRATLARNPELFGAAVAYEPRAFHASDYYFAPYCFRDQGRLNLTCLGSEAYNYFQLDWYQIPKEIGRPLWSEPYYDEGGGNIIMSTFSVPFYRDQGGSKVLQGVVTADLSLKWLTDLVSEVKIYQTGYAFLVSRNGVFVTHPDERLIMRESIFSLAEAWQDPHLRQIGRDMVRGDAGLVPLSDLVSGKKSWMYFTPLASTGWTLGVVIPEEELLAEMHKLSRKLIIIGLVGLVLLSVVIASLSKSITRPIRTLAETTAAIGEGDFSVSVPETGAREIVHLAHSFNQLGQKLTEYIAKRDFIRDTFGRYVTKEVVQKLLESKEALELGGEIREVSILMSDLRGFTALTSGLEPEQVITFLNRYLGKMIEVLMDHRAIIDEIIGDGILAFFGAPDPLEDHPVRAVVCAVAMQAAMEELNARNLSDGLPHLEMGIAVNTGAVVVGNIGSELRTKYSVIGSPVNVTGRMESFSVGGQVLISHSTYARVQELVEVGEILSVQMKGVPGLATLYDIRGIKGSYNLHLQERIGTQATLEKHLPLHLYRISEKIVVGVLEHAWITQLSETGAIIAYEGELLQWEDVRLQPLDGQGAEMPGKIYGKVIAVKTGDGLGLQADIRFTSVSPEIQMLIQQILGKG